MPGTKSIRIAVIAVIVCGIVVGRAAAQEDDSGPPVVVTAESPYIALAIGVTGQLSGLALGHTMTKSTPCVGGRFHIWNIEGDPTTLIDNSCFINWSSVKPPGPGDRWGSWEIMVDAVSSNLDNPERVWAVFDNDDGGSDNGRTAIWGEGTDGNWSISPRVPTNRNAIYAVWYPAPQNGISPTTLNKVSVLRPVVRCELDARVMRDTIRFKWTLKNEDTIDHMVGMKVVADLTPTHLEDGGTRELRNIVSIPGSPLLENRTLLSGTEIPPAIELFNSQSDPVHSIRLIFKGQGATPPDRVSIDDWYIVGGQGWSYWFGGLGQDPWRTWQYKPIEYDYIDDVAYGAFWKPRRLLPGQSMTVIHYIGIACATSDFTKPTMDSPEYVAAVQGPRALKYYMENGVGQLYPNPMTISAYLDNTEKYMDLQNATFTLTLPQGLTLDSSEGGQYTKGLSTIPARREGKVSWQVVPDGSRSGILNYGVSFSCGPVGATSVSRQVVIPATEQQPLSAGWQMMSVPFQLADPDLQTGLGLLPGAVLWKYDPHLQQYVYAEKVEPGAGYWLSLPVAQSTTMTPGQYTPIPWGGTQGYHIPLQVGWNLVGNPYLYAITIGETRFYHLDYGVLDYQQAVARGLISRTVFWWDPVFRTYNWNKYGERSMQIKPWQGYWLRVMRPGLTLIMSPVSQIGAGLGGMPEPGEGVPPVPPVP
ncbi:MAG TPA: hypothetical protein VMX94_00430 [Armatimonadota bacterium]|nr:hypothetical protein [Armatimonadota bacterium]